MDSNGHFCRNDLARAFELAYAPVVHGVLVAAVELNVFKIIAKAGPDAHLSVAEIASQLPKQTPETPKILSRMLLLLTSQSVLDLIIVTETNGESKKLYGLNSLSKMFVADENGITQAPTVLWGHAIRESCYSLKNAVLEGGMPFNKAYGMNLFEMLENQPSLSNIFNQTMLNRSAVILREILQNYKGSFDNIKKVVDVGGGFGSTINAVVSKYPHIQGINFDLPQVVRNAPAYSGVEHVEGDMFEIVPKGDAIILKHILHDWVDEVCLKLLRNCWDSLPDFGGKVIVIEMILPESPLMDIEWRNAFTSDILMHCVTAGGKERTLKQFENLAIQAGFTSTKMASRFHQYGVIEFHKN